MSLAGQKLGLRLFLEGIEVPVIAAQVQMNLNAPATAAIQVVPSDKLIDLKARTMVHLFFWDYTMDFDYNASPFTGSSPAEVSQRLGISESDAADLIKNHPETIDDQNGLRNYKLLYCGEVIGISNQKTPVGRATILQCSDLSTYWDTTYQMFMSYSSNGNFLGTTAAVWAGSDSMFNNLTSGHVQVVDDFLKKKHPETPGLQNVKGLMAGVISLLEAMGGIHHGDTHVSGVNDFFTIAELKNHLMQQIAAEENDDTAQRLFSEQAFIDWLTRGMSSMGQLVTFRDMLKLLFRYIYYETVPNPAAQFIRGKNASSTTKTVTTTSTSATLDAKTKGTLTSLQKYAQQQANAIFGGSGDDTLDGNNAKTFSYKLDEIINGKPPEEIVYKLSTAELYLENIQDTVDYQRPVSTVPAPNPQNNNDAPPVYKSNRANWQKVADILSSVLNLKPRVTKSSKKVKKTKAGEVDRLPTQILRPDCFFSAAPVCNVLFPEQYTQFSYSRNYLQEVTRLRLTVDPLYPFGGSGPGQQFLNNYFMAPTTKELEDLAKAQHNTSIRALLPWEKYSGILPKFEAVHAMNYVSGQSEKKMGLKPKGLTGASKRYSQRAANFNYLKYRFAARTCEVSAKFNPFLVVGFPAVVIDRPFIVNLNDPDTQSKVLYALKQANSNLAKQKITEDDISDNIRDVARLLGAPTQYIGMVAGLSHSVDQNGGGTSLTLTHARSHRITEDDFLSLYTKQVTDKASTETKVTTYDAEELIKKGDYKGLNLLISLTPQDLSQETVEVLRKEAQQKQTTSQDTSVELTSRPSGQPSLSTLSPAKTTSLGLAQLDRQNQLQATTLTPPVTLPDRSVFRGHTHQEQLQGGREKILVPDKWGTARPGKAKGPHGGIISQVQLFDDEAIAVLGEELDSHVKPRIITQLLLQPSQVPDSEMQVVQEGDSLMCVTSSSELNASEEPAPGISQPKPVMSVAPTVQKTTKKDRYSRSKTYFMWRKVAIYESVASPTRLEKLIPVEEALRPPWFSPLYSNWFIGDNIYQPFFGCGAVTDQALFKTPTGAAAFNTSSQKANKLLNDLAAADGDPAKIAKALKNAQADELSQVPDIESSIDALAYVYGEVRRLNLDVHKFVNNYTHRPIATLEEILGTIDLQYKQSGNKLELVSGLPGFHSTAVAPFDNLLGLLDNPDQDMPRLSTKGKKAPLDKSLDPRPGRRQAVEAYVSDINGGDSGTAVTGAGSLGVGLRG